MSQKLDNASGLYLEGIRDGKAHEAINRYTGIRYTQHSTGVRNGTDGFIEFFEGFLERNPVRDIRILRSIVDGNFVFVQVYQNINNGEARWVTTDLFDTDQEDRIIEHWDVISAYEEQSGPDQIDGPTEIEDLALTDANREAVRQFLCDVMVLGDREQVESYVDTAGLIEHRAGGSAGFLDAIGQYELVFKVIGQGNFVAAYSQIGSGPAALARFDLFRLQDGRIVEVWLNEEIIPPKAEWANGGKF